MNKWGCPKCGNKSAELVITVQVVFEDDGEGGCLVIWGKRKIVYLCDTASCNHKFVEPVEAAGDEQGN